MIRIALGLLMAMGLLGLYMMNGPGFSNGATKTPEAQLPPDSVPDVPDRTAIDFRYLPNNIYEMVCRLGSPFMVTGWDLDPQTRFVFFVGPFVSEDDKPEPRVYPYLYGAISGAERQRIDTTLLIDSMDEYLTNATVEELQRFQLPRLAAVDDRTAVLERILGKPDVSRELPESDRTRLIYDRRICFGEKLLAGMYFDVANGRVVNAKGIVHPQRLKWLLSGGRPPGPDTQPTYYVDVAPPEDSPQNWLLGFLFRKERGDEDGARELLSPARIAELKVPDLIRQTEPGVDIAFGTLTYQTVYYGRNSAEITARYELNSGTPVEVTHVMREEDGKWRLSR